MRAKRKLISILVTLSLLVTLLVPMVGPASASATYTVSNVLSISPTQLTGATNPNNNVTGGIISSGLGNIQITLDANSLVDASGWNNVPKVGYFRLPDTPRGYAFGLPSNATGYQLPLMGGNRFAGTDRIMVYPADPATINGVNTVNDAVYMYPYDTSFTNGGYVYSRIWKIVVNPTVDTYGDGIRDSWGGNSDDDGKISLSNYRLFVPSGASTGEVKLTLTASSGSIFSNGELAVAKVGNSTALLSVDSVPTFGSGGGDVTIYIKESNQGAIFKDLKLKLPPGFSWHGTPTVGEVFWGNSTVLRNNTRSATAGQGLEIAITDSENREVTLKPFNNNAYQDTLAAAAYFTLTGTIDIDETVARTGDVTLTASGATSVSPSSLVIAKYGDYKVSIAAVGDAPTIKAGKVEDQVLGKFKITEDIAGSIVDQRTVVLELPDNVKWVEVPVFEAGESTLAGVNTPVFEPIGNDQKTLKLTFSAGVRSTTDPATLVFKNAKVMAAADFRGDVVVKVSGSQGVSGGPLTLAKVDGPVDAKVVDKKDIMIGKNGQVLGDLIITEKYAGAIDSTAKTANGTGRLVTYTNTGGSAKLSIYAPAGVYFESAPKVEVTEGDLNVESAVVQSSISRNQSQIDIVVNAASTKPSTIKISGIKVNIDRTVPEGDLRLWVGGNAINNDQQENGVFTPERYTLNTVVANCVTPAPADVSGTAVFKIGDTKYTVNGVEKTMDVAPYLKNGRTYLPVRFVAQSLGVADNNIMWNEAEQSVVLIKGDRVVKLTIGSTTMMINGVAFTMDVAPEIVDPGRTMLPLRWVSQALGASVNWDNNTQKVTVTSQL